MSGLQPAREQIHRSDIQIGCKMPALPMKLVSVFMSTTKKSIFFRRLSSTLTLWTVILGTILMGWELGIYLIISGLGLIALWEFFTMLDYSKRPNFKLFGMGCGLSMLTGGYYWSQRNGPPSAYDFELAILMCFMLGVFARQMFQKRATRLRWKRWPSRFSGCFTCRGFSVL